jgi:23S rRNA pseudouridine1911/1915/1917 synthase
MSRYMTTLPPTVPPILYEDCDLLLVNKPAGLVVHPAYKHPADTLVDAVFARQTERNEPRPWLVHRLDRDTSGAVVFAKTERARRSLAHQFASRSVHKLYLAIVCGKLEPMSGLIDAPLQRDPNDRRKTIIVPTGQPSQTWYSVLASSGTYALVLAEPRTGRTHQIRAHLASRGAPLAGDICYDELRQHDTVAAPRVMLHAWQFSCTHPVTGLRLQVLAPMPRDMKLYIDELELGVGFEDQPRVLNT